MAPLGLGAMSLLGGCDRAESRWCHDLVVSEPDDDSLAAKLRLMPGTADVRYDRQWLNRLMTAINLQIGRGDLVAGCRSFIERIDKMISLAHDLLRI